MILMASGLAGHQYDFYDIVKDSPWLGGTSEYSGLHEGFPYWFNGLIPLAYGLDDARLKAQVKDALSKVLTHQQADGWLGPEQGDGHDLWGRFPLFLGLIQLVEADPSLGPEVIPAMYKFVNLMLSMLKDGTNFGEIWGRVRYADMIISLQWLYENYPENNKEMLLETMRYLVLRSMSWVDYYTEKNFLSEDLDSLLPSVTDPEFGFTHAVNSGQGLKTGAVMYRFMQNDTLLEATRNGVNWTFLYHGAASGTIVGDERESGLAPDRGSELCTAVETMYSLEYLYQMLGDNDFADRTELAGFNALPVMFSPDHWAHQYVAAPNQPFAQPVEAGGLYWNVGDNATMYGLEPNYPCCTVNMPQGYPKFLSNSFVLVGQNGLGHALLLPAKVSTTLPSGAQVSIACNTKYPFENEFSYTINASSPFTFHLRVPAWAESSAISFDNKAWLNPPKNAHTSMTSISLPTGLTNLTYKLATEIRIEHRANSTVAIHHGPLLYALDVGHSIQQLPPTSYTSHRPAHKHEDDDETIPTHAHDYFITNTQPWNIAIDPSTLKFHSASPPLFAPSSPSSSPPPHPHLQSPLQNPTTTHSPPPLPNPIWAPGAPPTYITAQGCEIDWPLYHKVPGPVPLSWEVPGWEFGNRTCVGGVVSVVLRPYGCLKVHMAELPIVWLGG